LIEMGGMEDRVQRAGNALARGVLRTPLLHRSVSGRMLIITTIGRKTGRRYRTPVGYVEVAGALLIGTGGNWHRNLRPDVPVERSCCAGAGSRGGPR
jgi:hypothetical protein